MISKRKMEDVRNNLDEGKSICQSITEATGKPEDYMRIMDLLEDEVIEGLWRVNLH